MNLKRRDVALGGAALLLLAIAVVRVAVPDRSRIRPLSIQGFDIASEPIGQGETVDREQAWDPPADVYVLGWNPRVGAANAGAELSLLAGSTRLFVFLQGPTAPNPALFPGGTGFLVRRGEKLMLRLRITNTGPPAHTLGASALVYFVPVEGN